MAMELAARSEGPVEYAGVEAEFVDPACGRDRRPLSA